MSKCSIKGCERAVRALGYCALHYTRSRGISKHRLSDPLPRQVRGFSIDAEGYKLLNVNGKRLREHRVIMEQNLGRSLKRDELVHHKNGDRLDNRLCNLEVVDIVKHNYIHGKTKVKNKMQVLKLYQKGMSARNIALKYHCSKSLIFRILLDFVESLRKDPQ